MKETGRGALKLIGGTMAFMGCLIAALYILNTTLQVKYEDGVITMQDFYRYPSGSIDVLLLGSSHLGSNVDTTQLYEEYGIAAYNLWGSAQPTWNTYYYLKEALKYQHPKVVVLETYVVVQDNDTTGYGTLIKSTSGMKRTENKYEAIQNSITNFDEIGLDVWIGWPTYHTRYSELNEADFKRYLWNYQLGDKAVSSWHHAACEAVDVSPVKDQAPLADKHETYFRKIVELCQEEGIDLYLFAAPYIVTEKEQMRFNTIAAMAREYQIPFENYNLTYQQFDFDYGVDFADAVGHMNDTGIAKITAYLGGRLKAHYELPQTTGNRWFMTQADESQSYRLPDSFQGDGESRFIDTGILLYDNPISSWTLLAEIYLGYGDEKEGVYFSCFNEDPDDLGGLLVRKVNNKLNIVVGSNYSTDIEVPMGDTVSLVIRKEKEVYSFYVGGDKIKSDWTAAYQTSYKKPLVIGCELDEQGEPYRFSTGRVKVLEIYSEAWSDSRIRSWVQMRQRTAADEVAREGLNYKLPGKFAGNGTTVYVDTGIPLYQDVNQDWTLLMDFNTVVEGENKIYLSCFDESGTDYRGLLIRQDEEVINVIVGNAVYAGIPMYKDHFARLAVCKQGDYYDIYANGVLVMEDLYAPVKEPYSGNLLLGAQESNHNKFRISAVTINRLEIHEGALESSRIANW